MSRGRKSLDREQKDIERAIFLDRGIPLPFDLLTDTEQLNAIAEKVDRERYPHRFTEPDDEEEDEELENAE